MRARWLAPIFVAAGTVALGWGCDGGGDAELPVEPDGVGPGGPGAGGGEADAGPDADHQGGSFPDGGLDPVYLGVIANPVSPSGGTPTPADVLHAELTAFAAGVRSATIEVRWDELDARFAEIESRVHTYDERGLRIVLTLL